MMWNVRNTLRALKTYQSIYEWIKIQIEMKMIVDDG